MIDVHILKANKEQKYKFIEEKLNHNLEDLKRSENGKPYFENSLYFNTSDKQGLCVIVFSDCEVGVDIESENINIDFKRFTLLESYLKFKSLTIFHMFEINFNPILIEYFQIDNFLISKFIFNKCYLFSFYFHQYSVAFSTIKQYPNIKIYDGLK